MYKILIVDDEKMIREGIRKVINWRQLGIDTVMLAGSGLEALEKMKGEKPDLMMTDISMANMTGLELIEKARTLYPELRVLVLTGYDSFEYARKALRLKVQDFLLKPVDEEVLTEAILNQIKALQEVSIREKAEKEKRRIIAVKEQEQFEQHLRDLLHKRNLEQCKSFLEENYEVFCKEAMSAAVLSMPLGDGKEEESGIVLYRQVQSFSVSLIDDKEYGVSIWDDDGKTLVVILFIERCGSDGVDLIRDLCSIIKNELGQSPRLAIGNLVTGYQSLNRSYQEALCLLENQQERKSEVLLSQSIQNRNRMFQDIFDNILRQMRHGISNSANIMRLFDSFQEAVHTYNLSDAYTRKCCYTIITSVYYAYIEAGASVTGQSLDSFVQSLTGTSGKMACEMTQHYLAKMLSKDEEVHDIVSKAKYFVNQHLAEELSVSLIADSMFVSPNYFSRLFKRITGEGCNEYIVRKRMEKARTLLETTNFHAGKIAKMVGYHDSNYFSITFKKHFGMSPTFYRNKELKRD